MPIKLFGRSKKAEDTPAEDDNKNLPAESEDDPKDQTDETAEDTQNDDTNAEGDMPEEDDVEKESEDDTEDDPMATAKAEGYAEALAVVQLASVADKSVKQALQMLQKGMTAAEASQKLLSEKKTKAKDDVSGHHKGAAAPETDRLAAKMKARFQK